MITRKSGSLIFGTKIVKANEYALLAKVMKDDGMTVREIALHIEAIDDMLMLQSEQLLIGAMRKTEKGRLRKNSSYLDFIDKRINLLIKDLKNENT